MNKILIIGNLTSDPTLRYTPQQTPVCNFTVAVNDRNGGEQSAQFFRVTAWRKLAEICNDYLAKGRKVFVSGPVRPSTYQASDGRTHVNLDVTAEDVEFLSPKTETQAKNMIQQYSHPTQQAVQGSMLPPSIAEFTPVDTGDDLPF